MPLSLLNVDPDILRLCIPAHMAALSLLHIDQDILRLCMVAHVNVPFLIECRPRHTETLHAGPCECPFTYCIYTQTY